MEEGKEVVSMEDANGENGEGINKYACGCAAVASMISIIFGYGTYIFLPFSFFPMQLLSRPETHLRGMTINSHPQAFSLKV